MAIRVKRSGYEVYYRDPVTGKQRSRYFKTRREAEKEERRAALLRRDGFWPSFAYLAAWQDMNQ